MGKRRLCRQGCFDHQGNPAPFKGVGCKHGKKALAGDAPAASSVEGPMFIPDASGSGINSLPCFTIGAAHSTPSPRPPLPDINIVQVPQAPSVAPVHVADPSLPPISPQLPLLDDNTGLFDWSGNWNTTMNIDNPLLNDAALSSSGSTLGMELFSISDHDFSPSSPSVPSLTPDSSDTEWGAHPLQGLDEAVLDSLLSSLQMEITANECSSSVSQGSASSLGPGAPSLPIVYGEHPVLPAEQDTLSVGGVSVPQPLHSAVDRRTSNTTKKRKKPSEDEDIDDGEDNDEPMRGYIEDDAARSKRHSERCKRILNAIRKLEERCRPYIFFYVSRPESILVKNGKALSYISQAMEEALPDHQTFVRDLHGIAHDHANDRVVNQASAAALNRQVHLAREDRRRVEHEMAVLRQQVEEERALRSAAESQLSLLRQTSTRL
ncbi:hypothetical protein D9615_003374 [Tricholomella constricta]|uniref:Uncharacterized protein n=1 Tax=Tricholomella constricta TaxID=117010 RepID=A0A8H5HJ24_9AGAR|nr:hypothetical protein D9615_003374 [Tricholomella constricta]